MDKEVPRVREKTGFEKSLEGEQKWPPETFRIRVVSTLLSGSDEFVPEISNLDIKVQDAIKIP